MAFKAPDPQQNKLSVILISLNLFPSLIIVAEQPLSRNKMFEPEPIIIKFSDLWF